MGWTEFEQTYGHLLPWSKAEEILGRKLDWNNNVDCTIYNSMLTLTVNEKITEGK